MKTILLLLIIYNSSFADYNIADKIFRPSRWTTALRPACPSPFGCFGYNTDLSRLQYFNGTVWIAAAAGPATSTDNAIARYDGTSGGIQNSSILISDTNDISAIRNFELRGTNTNNPAASTAAANFMIGRNPSGTLNTGQTTADISIEYGGGGGFKHYITSHHNSSVGSTSNSLNFYLNNGAVGVNSSAPGTNNIKGLAITALGTGVMMPSVADVPYGGGLDVVGDILSTTHGAGGVHNASQLVTRSIGLASDSSLANGFAGMKVNVSANRSDGTASANSSNLGFWTWGNSLSVPREVVRITETGRLGIGTTNPTQALHVVGSAVVSANLDVSGSTTLNGATVKGTNTNTPSTTNTAMTFFTGRTSAGALNTNQTVADIAFEQGVAAGGFKHYITTTHNAAASSDLNSMRFYINDSATAAGSSAPATGNKKSFEINALGSNTVGIANVTGSGVTGSPAMNLVYSGSYPAMSAYATSATNSGVLCFDCYMTASGIFASNTSGNQFTLAKSSGRLSISRGAATTAGATAGTLETFFSVEGTDGAVRLGPQSGSAWYAMPITRGTSGFALTTDGAGGTSWEPAKNIYQVPAALNIDWSTAHVFNKTVGADTTFTYSNQTDGQVIILAVTNSGASAWTITLPACKWSGGTAVTALTASSVTVFTIIRAASTNYCTAITDMR